MQYDVIVVGGGPAGSTLARETAASGLRVAVLDKAEFPRDKPCGGGVTARAAALLPSDLASVVERTVRGIRITVPPGTSIVQRSGRPITFLTQRRHLDAFLLQKARSAGATVIERAPVEAVERADGKLAIRAGGVNYGCRWLVAADGANGPTARLARVPTPRWRGVALEANANVDSSFPADWTDVLGIDFSHIRGGYGWLFPKGDHVNIGLGGWQTPGSNLRVRLNGLTRSYGFDPKNLWGLRGYPLPVRQPGAPLGSANMLLVGDAAGLLDPFTGEGLYAAVWSAQAAASRILDVETGDAFAGEALTLYAGDVQQHLFPDLRVARRIYDLFHLAPWIWSHALRSRRVWSLACRLLDGDLTYSRLSRDSSRLSPVLALVYEALKLSSRLAPVEAEARSLRRPLFFAG